MVILRTPYAVTRERCYTLRLVRFEDTVERFTCIFFVEIIVAVISFSEATFDKIAKFGIVEIFVDLPLI